MAKVQFGNRGGAKAPAKKKTATKKKEAAKKKAPAKKAASRKKPAKVVDAEVVEGAEEKHEVATTNSNPPAVAAGGAAPGIEGEVTPDDLRLPRINTVQAISDLHTKDDFSIGSIVLDKEIELMEAEGELDFVVLYLKKQYQQKLPWGSDETPLVLDTLEEIRAEGGTTNWSEEAIDDGRYFEQMANLVIALRAPDDLEEDQLFRFALQDDDGNNWARVAMTVSGSAFKAFAKNIITAAYGSLRDGIQLGFWTLSTATRSNKRGNEWYVPTSRFGGRLTEDSQVAFFTELAARDIPEDDGSGEG